MLVSFGLMTVITAGITSMLIRSVTREQQEDDQRDVFETLERIEAMLAAAHERLDQIERTAAVPNGAPTDD